ncbi:MAG: SPASM domain-containing protein [Phycisphaerales bacterium]
MSPELLKQLSDSAAGFADVLTYNPKEAADRPRWSGRELCDPRVERDTTERFIYDTPRSVELVAALAERLGDKLATADAKLITDTCRSMRSEDPGWAYRRLPRMVTMELTPRRSATGPITPHHHITFDRPDMDTGLAVRIVEQLGETDAGGDVTLLMGGLGDAVLHPEWERIVTAAHEAGVFSIGVETDLLCEKDELARVLDQPIDLVKIRFNADTADTYQKTMGTDGYKRVLNNIEYIFNERLRRTESNKYARGAMPWLVPSMVKTAETLPEMEGFFDKWTHYMGHALIEPACEGCGLMPAQSPVPMEPPDRRACLQLSRRMSILSDGTVAQCDQDWLGRAPIGDARARTLLDIWRGSRSVAEAHAQQRWGELTICGSCVEWHRP